MKEIACYTTPEELFDMMGRVNSAASVWRFKAGRLAFNGLAEFAAEKARELFGEEVFDERFQAYVPIEANDFGDKMSVFHTPLYLDPMTPINTVEAVHFHKLDGTERCSTFLEKKGAA